jgi:predicted dithiol-disulfide oxidoreductase (DUF899 family)
LKQRDVTFAVVSRAPFEKLDAYRRRMDWTFPWYSSGESSFNFDFNVSWDLEDKRKEYNFAPTQLPVTDLQGLSAFIREGEKIYHTYSTYARGIDSFNSAYQLLDLAPLGRAEDGLTWSMAWLRRHDEYEAPPPPNASPMHECH